MYTLDDLPLEKWSERYNVNILAMQEYYDSLCKHIGYVRQFGNKLGVTYNILYVHDFSKFTKKEFPFYADRFYGRKIRDEKFISALNHHYACNMHHSEYWMSPNGVVHPMPRQSILEMIADWQAASWQYTQSEDMQEWLDKNLSSKKFHESSRQFLYATLCELGYKI